MACNRKALTKPECDQLLDQALRVADQCSTTVSSHPPCRSAGTFWGKQPRIPPAVLPGPIPALPRRGAAERLITSIAKREPEVANLQFLNVTMSREADKECPSPLLTAKREGEGEGEGGRNSNDKDKADLLTSKLVRRGASGSRAWRVMWTLCVAAC